MPFIQMFQMGCIVVVTAVLPMLDAIARATKTDFIWGCPVVQSASPFYLLRAELTSSADEVQWP
jgi:hypothetical protein